ncbi:hypothetical protein DDI_1614 [Dickeya dianthicola RNS04.9]|nr:hypothetical protein DDI_1614 [Dickeya dianthicola RNS04.9]
MFLRVKSGLPEKVPEIPGNRDAGRYGVLFYHEIRRQTYC